MPLPPCYIRQYNQNNYNLYEYSSMLEWLASRNDPAGIQQAQTHAREIEMALLGEARGKAEARVRLTASHLAQLGTWLFEARRFLNFSQSTLYLTISLLDRLRHLRFAVSESKMGVLVASVLLLGSKFNEVEAVTVGEVAALLGKDWQVPLGEVVDMQAEILLALDYSITAPSNLFLTFCDLQEHFRLSCSRRVHEIFKICLQIPDLQRYGANCLIQAVALLCQGNRTRLNDASRQVKELMHEIRRKEEETCL